MSTKQEKKTLEQVGLEVLEFILKEASTNGVSSVKLFEVVEEKFKKHEKDSFYVRSMEYSSD